MATSPRPLVWDFYKDLGLASNIGGTVHYFDEYAQTIYLNEGAMLTRAAFIENGQWGTAFQSVLDEKIIQNSLYLGQIALDHPSNGVLYLVGTTADNIYFMRYVYAIDIANHIKSGTYRMSNANEITQANINVCNIGEETFDNDITLFQPGARLRVGVAMGDTPLLPLFEARIDEAVYNIASETSSVSARNNIGYLLAESHFGENNVLTGTPDALVDRIFELTGYDVQLDNSAGGGDELTFEFSPETTLLDGLREILAAIGMTMIETPDGKIVIGSEAYISKNYQKLGYYNFDKMKDVFSRKTSRSADAAYSKVYVTGQDSAGSDLEPIAATVNNYKAWTIPPNKTLFVEAPQGLTQDGLQEYAEKEAAKLQYAGIKEQITGPFRPQLLVGDIAREFETETPQDVTAIGIITEVNHTFGQQGFKTTFTTDSGGVVTEDGFGEVTSVTNTDIYGYNRTQRMLDYMTKISTKITKAITKR